jgi:polar amino acid transport system permease protein
VTAQRRAGTRRDPGEARGSRPTPWALGGLALLTLALAACSAGKGSYQYRWEFFFDSVFRPDRLILSGLWLTVSIAVISQLIGVILGVFGALGKMARTAPIRWFANLYVWLFRGTPLLVQISFLYFGLSVSRLYTWPEFSILGLAIAPAVQAGIVALGVNEGAYMTEIVRAGIISVDPGQMEAAKSLGMTYGKAMRRIVLPQAARVIVPPLGNEFNNMLKTTSLLVIISVPELYVIFSRKQGNAFAPFEFFLAAAVWYLLLTTIWSIIQSFIERRLGKGVAGAAAGGPGLRQRLFGGSGVEPSLVSGGR